MEEEKAAALYEELTRKGSGAARFKQGLGFSSGAASSASDPPPRGSALPPSSSSFLSQFVKASNSTSEKPIIDREKQKSQIESIQNKLRKKDPTSIERQSKDRDTRNDRDRDRDRDSERHSREIRSTERRRRRSRSRSYSSEDRDRRRERRRSRRSRSRSFSDEDRKRRRERRRRSKSSSPNYERSEKGRGDRETRRRSVKKENNGGVDYAKLVEGYDEMTPAERVKAKMKLQLSETAAKDTKIGTGSGWERFEFNKDAPLDNEDEEVEGAHDDTKVVKHLGQTFRFSNVQARREEEIKAAHDEAMFGAPVAAHDEAMLGAPVRSSSVTSEGAAESENEKKQIEGNDAAATGLFSDKLLAKKQGSWRDRAPRNMN